MHPHVQHMFGDLGPQGAGDLGPQGAGDLGPQGAGVSSTGHIYIIIFKTATERLPRVWFQ